MTAVLGWVQIRFCGGFWVLIFKWVLAWWWMLLWFWACDYHGSDCCGCDSGGGGSGRRSGFEFDLILGLDFILGLCFGFTV